MNLPLLVALCATTASSTDPMQLELDRVMDGISRDSDNDYGTWPPPIGRSRERTYTRRGAFGLRFELSRMRESQTLVTLRRMMNVNPVRVDWTRSGFGAQPIGEAVCSRQSWSGPRGPVFILYAYLGEYFVTTAYSGHSRSSGLDEAVVTATLNGSARALLALAIGQSFQPLTEGAYRSMFNVPRLFDGERTYIPLDVWLQARNIVAEWNNRTGVLSTTRNGRDYRFYAGTAKYGIGNETRSISSVIVRKNGTWWVPYGVFDQVVP